MENRKNSPPLANFCKVVNSLGYEIKIVKKINVIVVNIEPVYSSLL